jgi:hypothetical protein
MFTLWFDRSSEVLVARFSGAFTTEDFAALDAALIQFLSGEGRHHSERMRAIFDLSAVEVVAVPESKAVEQARRPPIVRGQRVVVAPRIASDDFGRIYRSQQREAVDSEPVIVASLDEAYALLGLAQPQFTPVEQS